MFKICILFALAITSVATQEAPAGGEAAPEPYSYGYQTDTHAASEQRDPSGKVTGFYTLVGEDGRERRVEYIADEAGFRAKIATNEVGTKSENPADVEIQASEPTPGQLVYQNVAPQVVQAAPLIQRQQVVQQQQQQQRLTTVKQPNLGQMQYYQPASYGYNYNPGYRYGNLAYGNNYGYGAGYGSGYGLGYGSGYGYAYNPGTYGYGLNTGNYNNILPSQYYRSAGSTTTTNTNGAIVPATYAVNGQSVRYFNQPVGANTATRTVGTSSNLQGSSNYLVLQKRATEEKKSS